MCGSDIYLMDGIIHGLPCPTYTAWYTFYLCTRPYGIEKLSAVFYAVNPDRYCICQELSRRIWGTAKLNAVCKKRLKARFSGLKKHGYFLPEAAPHLSTGCLWYCSSTKVNRTELQYHMQPVDGNGAVFSIGSSHVSLIMGLRFLDIA